MVQTRADTSVDDQVSFPEAASPSRSARRLHGVDWPREALYLIGVLGAVALSLSLVGRHAGWPLGQTPPDLTLVQIYGAHLRHGDLFPVWSSSDAYGMGTPVLAYYQRLIFFLGGVVYDVFGLSLKASLVLTIGSFMVVGAYGMRRALSAVTESRLLSYVGSIAFLFTNWTFAEWLVRGDLAEFAAFMIVPWLIHWCIRLVKDGTASWSIIPILVLLVEAHNAIALLSVVLLIVTGIVFFVSHGTVGLRRIFPRCLLYGVITAVILSPVFIIQGRFGSNYDPATKIIYDNKFLYGFPFAHPWDFLFNPSYHWFSGSQLVPYQLDFAITFLLAVGVVTALVCFIKRAKDPGRYTSPISLPNRAIVILLLVSFCIYQLLQWSFSYSIYTSVWQLDVIGYPFRMATFSVPLALILAVVVADWYLRWFRNRSPKGWSWTPPSVAALWLGSFLFFSPLTANFSKVAFAPMSFWTRPSSATFTTSRAIPLFSEDLPIVRGRRGKEVVLVAIIYNSLHEHRDEAESLSSVPCSIRQTGGASFESLRVAYRVTCSRTSLVALPISFNRYTSITEQVSPSKSRRVSVLHVPSDPRIVIRIQGPGPHNFVVDLPTAAGVLFGG